MHGEAAQKFHSIHGNRFFNGSIPVIFCNEGHLTASNIQNALIGNGHPVGILPQVFYHMFSSGQGRFTMYDPPGMVSLLNHIIEQLQLMLLSQGSFEAVQEPTFKSIAELINRIEEFP